MLHAAPLLLAVRGANLAALGERSVPHEIAHSARRSLFLLSRLFVGTERRRSKVYTHSFGDPYPYLGQGASCERPFDPGAEKISEGLARSCTHRNASLKGAAPRLTHCARHNSAGAS